MHFHDSIEFYRFLRRHRWDIEYHLSVVDAQFLRGCLSLGALLSKHSSSDQAMSSEQVYHMCSF